MVVFSQEEKESFWVYDLTEAKEIAKKENKTIVLYFTGSDWCRPCMMLKEDFFGSYKFSKYKNSFVFLYIDIPRDQDLLTEKQKIENYKVLDLYNKAKTFPLIFMINHKGKILDQISGYSSLRDPSYHFDLLSKFTK
ncbi:hypothetical protein GCM10022258_15480 [Aquimarina gracilis]